MTVSPGASRTTAARSPSSEPYLERGSRAYWHACLALLFAGYATFSLLYCVQPLLPAFSGAFGVSPAQSSLSLSLATGALAIAIFFAGFVSEGWSRRTMMTASLSASSLLALATAFVPHWHELLVLRTLQGLALGGVPAVAMAWLAEEMHPDGLGLAMGLYVGGTAVGGMTGRVITGVLTDLFGWRVAMGAIAVLGIGSMLAFRALLPPSRHFTPKKGLGFTHHRAALLKHFARPGLPALFAMGFVLMGGFVTLYNYIGYRLIAPPYNLSQSAIASIFIVYLTGVVASPWSGRMADAFGRGRVLIAGLATMLAGVMLTLLPSLGMIAAGIGLLTIGFFAGHSAASSWVGRLAREAKGQAAALYLLAYYLGSSIVGSIGGHFWTVGGWGGVVTLVVALLVVGLVLAWKLRVRERAGTA